LCDLSQIRKTLRWLNNLVGCAKRPLRRQTNASFRWPPSRNADNVVVGVPVKAKKTIHITKLVQKYHRQKDKGTFIKQIWKTKYSSSGNN